MIHKIFSVYDAKAEAYLPLFCLPTVAMAQRTFNACVNSEDHQFGAFPEDYTLFELGNWDDSIGQITINRVQQSHGNGLEYVKPTTGQGNGQIESVEQTQAELSVLSSPASENSPE